jgi:hypothetical protein
MIAFDGSGFSYYLWSVLNIVALVFGLYGFLLVGCSIFFDCIGRARDGGRLYVKGLNIMLCSVFFVLFTQWLGVNSGYFPVV